MMLDNYLIVSKSILPDYYEKVLEAKRLIESGKIKEVSQAVKVAGISRSTYYKYKDFIMEPSAMSEGRKAVLSMMLNHEPGVLSSLLSVVSAGGYSVLTITQSLPIHSTASVTLSLDVSGSTCSISELLDGISSTPGVESARLVAIE